jgi:putative membrane protein
MRHLRTISSLWVLAGLLLGATLLPACGNDDQPPQPGLSAAQIAGVTNAINNGEIQHGQLAIMRAMNEDVRDFAQRMLDEHTMALQEQTALLARLGVTPVESDQSRQISQEAMRLYNDLQGRAGADFDRAYLDAQVTLHMRALTMLDNQLLPAVQNAEFRQQLQDLRSDVSAHLQDASQLRDQINTP